MQIVHVKVISSSCLRVDPATSYFSVTLPLSSYSFTGMRRVSWSIWLITQMLLPDNRRLSRAFKAASGISLSSVPKPPSKNNDSSLEHPLLSSDSARASDRLTRNDLPPIKGLDRALFACVLQVYYHHVLQVNSPQCIFGGLRS